MSWTNERLYDLRFALRETFGQLRSRQSLAVLGAVSVVLGISGPFGTMASLDLVWRLAYWLLVVPLTFAAGSLGSYLGHRFFDRFAFWIKMLLTCLLSAGLVWTVLMVTHSVLDFSFAKFSNFSADFPLLVLICFVIEGARAALLSSGAPVSMAPDAPLAAPAPRLLDRLPEALRGDLVSLSVYDHYVSVTTVLGSHDALLRLSDAMAEAEPVAGLQVHRSHWVATAHVRGWQRTGDKALLVMSNGALVPVSRGKLKMVEEAGIFARTPEVALPSGPAEAAGADRDEMARLAAKDADLPVRDHPDGAEQAAL